jgi:hypothetical protein
MQTQSCFSIPGKLCRCVLLTALASLTTMSIAQDNTFSGTYTFVSGGVDTNEIQFNMFGQEVGFCPNGSGQLPYGYSCNENLDQDVLTGTLIADGNGNITTGSSYVFTADPNRYQCSSHYNATPDCPYKVPSGIPWNSGANYVVGDEVDSTVGGKLLTFQAVKNNTGVPPNGNTCASNVQVPPNCTWDQLYVSATGKGGGKGTLAGTYTVQSNGSGVLKLTPSGNPMISFSMVVPTAPLAVGQVVPLVALPTLANEFRGNGAAVRIK